MKKVKVATLVIMAIAMVYVAVLALVNDVPSEGKIALLLFQTSQSALELPFPVSYWWNLLWFPVYITGIVYIINKRKITGEESRSSSNKSINEKHQVRVITFIMNALWIVVSIWMSFIGMIVGFFDQGTADVLGPLSSIMISIQMYFIMHVCFGPLVEFLIMLFEGDEPLIEEYEAKFLAFVKSGLVRSLPYLITITLAFALRYVIGGVVNYFTSIRVSFKKVEGGSWIN